LPGEELPEIVLSVIVASKKRTPRIPRPAIVPVTVELCSVSVPPTIGGPAIAITFTASPVLPDTVTEESVTLEPLMLTALPAGLFPCVSVRPLIVTTRS